MTTTATRNPGWTLALVCVAGALMTLDITILNIGLEEIATGLGATLPDLQWVVSVYPLVFAALLLPAGSLSDRIGRKRMFIVGVGVFTASSVACGLATGPVALTVARAVQGIGGAMTYAPAIPLLAQAYPPQRRASAMGVFSGVSAGAAALGPLAGGALVDTFGWRSMFFVNLVPGVLLLVGTAYLIAESGAGRRGGRFDLPGTALATGTLFAINYTVVTGAEGGWSRLDVVVSMALACVGLLAFLAVECRSADPMLDLGLFRISSFSGAAVLSLLTRMLNLGTLTYLALWLQGMLGYSPLQAGLRLLPLSVLAVVTSLVAGRLVNRLGLLPVLATGFAGFAVGFALLTRIGPDSPWTVALAGFFVLGAAAGLLFPPLITISVGVVPPERSGMASGLVNSFFPLGTALGVSAFGAVLSARVEAGMTGAPEAARAAVAAGRFGGLEPPVVDLAKTAFADGIAAISLVSLGLALLGVLIAVATIRTRQLRG
ncbi:MFS transporter [Saccharopolyspora spinosa]|uniref:EmrB/QacA subfamily drug resistance transporter n=1 Tax=Saccharopolyspora spinosa TaxID=60894 RepID=A0A2N3Y0M3_SACSN|nr:MFS transporter [Saccharopolyspora spinosa]PKW16467.1 EmrB/QacA subfamily drug resistance transporter [Saccharopolyspora spinosa]